MDALETLIESSLDAASLPYSLVTLNPVTPLRNGGDVFSAFALFSEEKRGCLSRRVVSPAISFEELSKILAEEWERLPEEDKTPYRERANERRLRHETMGAALALTQIGTPSLRPGVPTTPVPDKKNARRCLDIGTPDWQSPRALHQAAENSYFGGNDANSGAGASADRTSADRAGLLDAGIAAASMLPWFPSSSTSPVSSSSTPSSTPSASAAALAPGPTPSLASPPPARGTEALRRRRGGAGRLSGTPQAAAAASTPTPAKSGIVRDGGGDGGGDVDDVPIARVGLEVRAAAGGTAAAVTAAAGATTKNGGSSISVTHTAAAAAAATHLRGRGSSKGATTFSGGRRRVPSSSGSSSFALPKRAQLSSSTKPPAVAAQAASAVKKKARSEERARKAAYKTGKALVSKMSKNDPARPKGPQSSYIIFYTEKMAAVKADRPGMGILEIGTAVGQAWRGLSDEQRAPYTRRAEADRKRYEDQLRALAKSTAVAAAATAAATNPGQ